MSEEFGARLTDAHEAVMATDDPATTLGRLAPLLRSSSPTLVKSVQYGLNSLEDLFLRLTNKRLRD